MPLSATALRAGFTAPPRILAPGAHLEVPQVSFFLPKVGHRLRNPLAVSGSRQLAARDLTEVGDLAVTTPLRTACDLGRLLHRDQAFAALDSLLRQGDFSRDELLHEVGRFRGMRHVTKLRELAPWADRRSQSPGESILRLRWLDCSELPRPEPQVEVPGRFGFPNWLDLGVPGLLYAAEYNGAEWHGPDQEEDDAERAVWLREALGWTVDPFVGTDVHGPLQCADVRLRRSLAPLMERARRTSYFV